MKKIDIGKSGLNASAVILGCMRIGEMSEAACVDFLEYAVELGINHFDHADIYGGGTCEELFGRALKSSNICREDIIIQSKCAIHDGIYDFSREHILRSVDGSLRRLGTDYIDILLLHRPDTLMEPEEVASAFDELYRKGKVRKFGVSNQTPGQMKLLQKFTKHKLICNQLQFSPTNTTMLDSGLGTNMSSAMSVDRDGGILDHCRLNDITIQAWSPFQYGFFGGTYIGSDKYPELNKTLETIAAEYNTTPTAIASAWILRHPANMQLIAGTTKTSRLKEIIIGSSIALSRPQWYAIYKSAGNRLP